MVPILSAVAAVLDILAQRVLKTPTLGPVFAPLTTALVKTASQAAEETEEQTAARVANHDAIVAKYSKPPGGTET